MNKTNRLGGVLLALSLAGASATASATVVFNWETLSTSNALTFASGQVKISDTAFRQGSLGVNLGAGSYPDINGPIEEFEFILNDGANAYINPLTAMNGFTGTLEASLSTNPDGTTDGRIYANNTDTEVEMSGRDGIWEILRAGSDNPAIGEDCFFDHDSCTATGQWRLDPTTVPASTVDPDAPEQERFAPNQKLSVAAVPEPGAQAMFGLALALIGGALWRRRAAAETRIV